MSIDQKLAEAQKVWADIDMAVNSGQRVLLWGPPGTGKSYAGTRHKNVFRLYLTMDTPAAEVRGHYLPSESGGFKWHDGPATSAWREGGRLVIDEIDAASGDTLTLLLGYLDDRESARITLPTNESIVPHRDFSCVATTNQMPTILPEALLDRFDIVLQVPMPNPIAFALKSWHNQDICEAAKRAIYLGDTKARGHGGRPIGLRNYRAIDRLTNGGVKIEDASRLVIGEQAAQWFCMALKVSKSTA